MFIKIRAFLSERIGLHFGDRKKRLLEDRLQLRLKANGLASFEEYWRHLSDRENRKAELPALYDSVTSWDTRFFRHPEQIEALTGSVLPDIVKSKGKKRAIRVWSAGCSTGDEAYTLAIVLDEFVGRLEGDWTAEVVGTDLSESALAIARKGRYAQFSLRDTPPAVLGAYFEHVDASEYLVRPDLRERVAFRMLNLTHKAMVSTMADYDVIFCRNVITYFNTDTKNKVMDQLASSLRYGGYLFLGQAESLYGVTTVLNRKQVDGALVYKKE